jgi:hypothetical protein
MFGGRTYLTAPQWNLTDTLHSTSTAQQDRSQGTPTPQAPSFTPEKDREYRGY